MASWLSALYFVGFSSLMPVGHSVSCQMANEKGCGGKEDMDMVEFTNWAFTKFLFVPLNIFSYSFSYIYFFFKGTIAQWPRHTVIRKQMTKTTEKNKIKQELTKGEKKGGIILTETFPYSTVQSSAIRLGGERVSVVIHLLYHRASYPKELHVVTRKFTSYSVHM